MLLFLLTLTGATSLVIMARAMFVAEHRSFTEGVLHFVFGFISFVITAFLSNVVQP